MVFINCNDCEKFENELYRDIKVLQHEIDVKVEITNNARSLSKHNIVKSLPKRTIFSIKCIGCKLFENYKKRFNIPF